MAIQVITTIKIAAFLQFFHVSRNSRRYSRGVHFKFQILGLRIHISFCTVKSFSNPATQQSWSPTKVAAKSREYLLESRDQFNVYIC
jgi:hypothetical protein